MCTESTTVTGRTWSQSPLYASPRKFASFNYCGTRSVKVQPHFKAELIRKIDTLSSTITQTITSKSHDQNMAEDTGVIKKKGNIVEEQEVYIFTGEFRTP